MSHITPGRLAANGAQTGGDSSSQSATVNVCFSNTKAMDWQALAEKLFSDFQGAQQKIGELQDQLASTVRDLQTPQKSVEPRNEVNGGNATDALDEVVRLKNALAREQSRNETLQDQLARVNRQRSSTAPRDQTNDRPKTPSHSLGTLRASSSQRNRTGDAIASQTSSLLGGNARLAATSINQHQTGDQRSRFCFPHPDADEPAPLDDDVHSSSSNQDRDASASPKPVMRMATRSATSSGKRNATTAGKRKATKAGKRKATKAGKRKATTAGKRKATTAGKRNAAGQGEIGTSQSSLQAVNRKNKPRPRKKSQSPEPSEDPTGAFDFKFEAVCGRYGPVENPIESRDWIELVEISRCEVLMERIQQIENLWIHNVGPDWQTGLMKEEHMAEARAGPACLSAATAGKQTRWREGDYSDWYACKDCVKHGRPCFWYGGLEQGILEMLPLHPDDRRKKAVYGKSNQRFFLDEDADFSMEDVWIQK